MTTENKTTHSPLPWRVEESISGNKNIIVSADGREVGSIFGVGRTECAEKWEANAALIVEAVNEREKLRGIVRRMLPFIERSRDRLCDGQRLHGTEGDFSPAIHELTEIIIEADAALGREADDGQE